MTPNPHPEPERQAPGESGDPFSEAADASRETCEIRSRAFTKPEQPCDVASKPKRKKTDLNPLERRWFEKNGWTWARVEAQNAWGGMTKDLWACWDYVAVRADVPGVLFVQVCTLGDLSKRRRKILNAPETAVLLAAGNQAEVHGWSQPGGPGSRWELERRPVTVEATSR